MDLTLDNTRGVKVEVNKEWEDGKKEPPYPILAEVL